MNQESSGLGLSIANKIIKELIFLQNASDDIGSGNVNEYLSGKIHEKKEKI